MAPLRFHGKRISVKVKQICYTCCLKVSMSSLYICFYFREKKGITVPNLVMPDTGHVAFDKVYKTLDGFCWERGHIGLFITQVPKVL